MAFDIIVVGCYNPRSELDGCNHTLGHVRMEYDDPVKIEEAKQVAKGPLGQTLLRQALSHSAAAFFGELSTLHRTDAMSNGTAALIDLGQGPIAITCAHVLAAYRKAVESCPEAVFQLGSARMDPIAQLIAEDPDLDLATFTLTSQQTKEINTENCIGSSPYRPHSWPPRRAREGDFVFLGGFPGRLRQCMAKDRFEFNGFTVGGTPVTSVSEDHFICRFEREYWVQCVGDKEGLHLSDLGGMSGAPVYVETGNVIKYLELIGIAYEFSSSLDAIFVRHASFIHLDGLVQGRCT